MNGRRVPSSSAKIWRRIDREGTRLHPCQINTSPWCWHRIASMVWATPPVHVQWRITVVLGFTRTVFQPYWKFWTCHLDIGENFPPTCSSKSLLLTFSVGFFDSSVEPYCPSLCGFASLCDVLRGGANVFIRLAIIFTEDVFWLFSIIPAFSLPRMPNSCCFRQSKMDVASSI